MVPASFHFTRFAVAPNSNSNINSNNNSNNKLLKASNNSRSSPGSTAASPTAAAAKLTDNNSTRDMNSQGTAVIGNLVLYSEANYSVVGLNVVFA